VCETKPLTNLFSAQRKLRTVVEAEAAAVREVDVVGAELREVEREIAQYLRDAEQMRRQLNERSDHFALARRLTRALAELQTAFADMFARARKAAQCDDVAALAQENAELGRRLLERQFQLEICSLATRRMRVREETEKVRDG
jgi:hypothetical protein